MNGALVVEDTVEKYDKDYTLMLDEWVTDKKEIDKQIKEMTRGKTEKSDGDKTGVYYEDIKMDKCYNGMRIKGHDMSMHDLFTINGKSRNLVEPLKMKKGDKVRLRLINADYLAHNSMCL